MNEGRRKVVVVGAAGKIAGQVLPFFRDRYDLTLLDIRTVNGRGDEVEGVQIVDLMNPDRDAYRHFHIFYGISDNPHAFWSVANARQVIGYAPEDNSEIRFRDLIAEHIAAANQGGD